MATYRTETMNMVATSDIKMPAARLYLCHGCYSRSSNSA